MRYAFQENNKDELVARKKYLYDVFKLYFIPIKMQENFIMLQSLPSNCLSIFFITGHRSDVMSFLIKNKDNIAEDIVVINSCFDIKFKNILKNKKHVYISNYDDWNYSNVRDGRPFGIDFNITNSELNLLNARNDDFVTRFNKSFVKLS